MSTAAYADLAARQLRSWRFIHLQSIAQWDQAANMPPAGNEARSLALAELDGLLHSMATDPALPGLMAAAEGEPLDDLQRANLREIRRAWRSANALPASSLSGRQNPGQRRCEHAWRSSARERLAGFAPNLREVLALARQEVRMPVAKQRALKSTTPCWTWYEPGMRSARWRVCLASCAAGCRA